MESGSFDVYTQYNAWQNESRGGWDRLVTQVTAASLGIRTCDGATPMMALNNLYNGMNTVFHLLPNAQWKITAKKISLYDRDMVVVETGFNNENLRLTVNPEEEIELPTVIFFNAASKTDFDAYKLHEVYNKLYPRKSMPVLYNSWLYCFDNLDVDALLCQVDAAAELGFEAFMIDAGWFGNGADWSISVGDWKENTVNGPKGRLIDISNRVREKGMIFGLWFEPERATPQSESVKKHPDYYIDKTFLDFANPNALEYMVNVISELIEKYSIGWIKFDFNATIPLDPTGNAFYRYLKGQKRFIRILREKYPYLYITNCASGGFRMELEQGGLFDSFWLSDNQGSYEGIRIVKDTLKRMPTSLIERWNVQKYADGFIRYGQKEKTGLMLSCNNGTWDFIISVDDSFTKAFISGGPIGFSYDIAEMPQQYKEAWKKHIEEFKNNRAFYMNATARILVDTDDIIAIQYADSDLNRLIFQLFIKTTPAADLTVFPVVDKNADYVMNGENVSGEWISENGICFIDLKHNSSKTIELIKCD